MMVCVSIYLIAHRSSQANSPTDNSLVFILLIHLSKHDSAKRLNKLVIPFISLVAITTAAERDDENDNDDDDNDGNDVGEEGDEDDREGLGVEGSYPGGDGGDEDILGLLLLLVVSFLRPKSDMRMIYRYKYILYFS